MDLKVARLNKDNIELVLDDADFAIYHALIDLAKEIKELNRKIRGRKA